MQVTVFGASGHVGRLLVRRLLADGHSVVAFVHQSNPFRPRARLTVVRGDVHDPVQVARALQGSQAVISTLGSWGTPAKDVLTSAMRAVIPAMQAQGIKRVITLTGADAHIVGDRFSLVRLVSRGLFRSFSPKVLQDSENHMRLLLASGLDWTVLRSPVMRSWGKSHSFVVTGRPPLPWHTVHRRDVANALADQLNMHSCIAMAPFINRRRR